MLPNFLVVGAARSGTTSLHYYLAQHPDICMSSIKEPNFFVFAPDPSGRPQPCIGDDSVLIAKSVADRAGYERLFAVRGERAVGEASPLYLYTRETPSLVRDLVPQMRVIAIVREPVDRTWSHFVYVNGEEGEAVSAFAAAVERELPLGYEPYRTGTHFVRLSRYAEQLERWRAAFPDEQLLVLSYDALVSHPASALREVCTFLGVDAGFTFDTRVAYNPSTGGGSVLHRADRALRPAYAYLKRVLPAAVTGPLAARRARARAASRGHGRPPLPAELQARLDEHFAPDRAMLARDWGITF